MFTSYIKDLLCTDFKSSDLEFNLFKPMFENFGSDLKEVYFYRDIASNFFKNYLDFDANRFLGSYDTNSSAGIFFLHISSTISSILLIFLERKKLSIK